MVVRMEVGGVDAVKALSINKTVAAPSKDKGKKGLINPAVSIPKVLKTVQSKIKKLEQEIQQMEKSAPPSVSKEATLRSKKAELAALNRQEARLKNKKAAVPSLRKKAAKKNDGLPDAASPAAMKKKLKGLKEKLKQAEKGLPTAQENIQNLKAKVRLMEAQLAAKKGAIKI